MLTRSRPARIAEALASDGDSWILSVVVAVLCAGLATIAIVLTESGGVAAIWPMNGFVLALLIQQRGERWPLLLGGAGLGDLVANLLTGSSWGLATSLTSVNILEILVCALAFKRFAGNDSDITERRPLLSFLGIALVVPLGSALVAAVALTVLGGADFHDAFWHWYAADALGLMIFTPVFLAVDWRTFGRLAQAQSREMPLLLLPGVCLLALLVFGQSQYPFLFMISPALVAIAFGLGIGGTALGLLLTTIVAVVLTLSGHGPTQLVSGSESDRILVLQIFLAFTALTTLPIAATITRGKRVTKALEGALRESEALSEQRVKYEEATLGVKAVDGRARGSGTGTSVFATLPKYIGLASVGLGCMVLFGWALGIGPLKSVLSGLETMKPITALTLIASGVTLYLASPLHHAWVQKTLAYCVVAISVVTLIQFAFEANLLIGDFLITQGWVADATRPMSVVSAAEFALFGLAMALPRRRYWMDFSFVCATMLGTLVSLLVLAGYLYNIPILYKPTQASSIALHTGVACLALFIGAAFTRPYAGWVTLLGRDSVTRTFAPWLLPAIVVLPIGLGWVINQVTLQSHISAEFGVDLFALASVFLLIIVVWRTGTIANRLGRNLELRQQLEARLTEARIAAEEAAAAKSEFLANVTHELRTPLNSIIGFAGLLAKSPKLSAKTRRYAEIIDGSSQSLLALVNDILDVSRLEAGGLTLHAEPFSLSKLVELVAASFSLAAQEKGIKLKVERGNLVGPLFLGDEARLRQVLVNLINNAIKFTDKGLVTIVISATEAAASTQPLRIEVRDTGIGIPADKIGILFERFSQANSSIHGRFGGTGLGLVICKRLIELMGGAIGIESVEGKGTSVWIDLTLPCVDPSSVVKKDVGAPMLEADGIGRRILVVDDVDLNRDLVAALLAPHGYEVDQAPGGAEAVEAVKSATYDVVLMDVQMPGIDGLAATRMIRAMEGFKELPIIAMTAQALPEQIEQCHEAGMSDYLAKPITPTSLVAALGKWIGDKHVAKLNVGTIDRSLRELRDEFVAQCAKDLATIRALLDSPTPSAHQQLRDMVHRMAGTAGMLGFERLSLDAKALEGELANGTTKDVSRGSMFLAALERVVRAA